MKATYEPKINLSGADKNVVCGSVEVNRCEAIFGSVANFIVDSLL